jgi:hypothetical protein
MFVVMVSFVTAVNDVRAQSVLGGSAPLASVATRVLPDTVRVGQPFTVTLRIVGPAGWRVTPPPMPDTGGVVEPLDPAVVSRRGDTVFVRYRFLAWQPGVLVVPLGAAVQTSGTESVEVPFDARVVVASVLPVDTTARVPRAARAPIDAPRAWWDLWWRWVLGGAVVAAALFGLMAWLRRRRALPPPPPASAREQALAALERLRNRELPSIGEAGRHVVLASEILRRYLAATDESLSESLSVSELTTAAAAVFRIDSDAFRSLLTGIDVVRFSGDVPDTATAERLIRKIEILIASADSARIDRDARAA